VQEPQNALDYPTDHQLSIIGYGPQLIRPSIVPDWAVFFNRNLKAGRQERWRIRVQRTSMALGALPQTPAFDAFRQ
jgi:hypothetical protein